MERIFKRLIKRFYPELTGGLHLPHWGRVANQPAAITTAAKSTEAEPLYCVDVQLLDAQGRDDNTKPLLLKLPLPATGAADQRGLFAFPQKGTLVELGFIQGHPHKPFIRSVLVERQTVPNLGATDVLLKQSEPVYQRADDGGNWTRTTPADITDSCANYSEIVAKVKHSRALLNQHIEVAAGGKVWLGSEGVNVLQLLSDLMQQVQSIATQAATHTHPSVAPCSQAGAFNGYASATAGLKGQLDPIKE